jgi:DNA-binding transcriptional ArsR family regulator
VSAFPDLATIGSLVGEPTKAAMLSELFGGQALTAGELASRAGVTASTASAHLARLVHGGLLSVVSQGRHRYYRLAGSHVAAALEALAGLASAPAPRGSFEGEVLSGLRFARTCYRHLAGRLGVAIRGRLLERELLREDGIEHRVTAAGAIWFTELGIDLDAAAAARGSFARARLDWTERRPHLAGAVGDALLTAMTAQGWLRRLHGERALELTAAGVRGLEVSLGLHVDVGPASAGVPARGATAGDYQPPEGGCTLGPSIRAAPSQPAVAEADHTRWWVMSLDPVPPSRTRDHRNRISGSRW